MRKIKCKRPHVKTPYGTLLEQNIEIRVNDAIVVAEAHLNNFQFLNLGFQKFQIFFHGR